MLYQENYYINILINKLCYVSKNMLLIHYYSEISVSLYLYVRPDMELGAFCKTDNMIETITVKNFKSITDMTLSLGNVNVFIGANGSGKSNILEAIAMVAAERSAQIEVNSMIQKGIRIAKTGLDDKFILWSAIQQHH